MCETSAFMGYCFQGTNLTVTVSLSKLHTQIVIFHLKLLATFSTGKNIHCMYSVFPKGQNIINLVEKTLKYNKVCTGHGKPGKSSNLTISFFRPRKSLNVIVGPEKSLKLKLCLVD